ncbi:plasmid pRiA4b ORF-3 family protein [Lactiplantibacillus modestisalitolerans]|uniref:Plasmid pRiA4b ORF-3 family protein n=1 Tax=Lactiplantibacillus modestisalitolerans TaxID=1457219 RepID=A0ABV5WSZ6_9LACO|nr:plasmid pRiA4b ORF-3 family protein [Lactiplantibacillus modestisalitolerans]
MKNPTVAMEIKVKLLDVQPAASRTLQVPLSLRYDQLHTLIQLAFDWENYHMYAFQPKGTTDQYLAQPDPFADSFGEPAKLAAEHFVYPDLANGPVTYTYDFGADWRHEITLNRLLTFSDLDTAQLPICKSGRGNNRVEDDGQPGTPYNRKHINRLFALWARAGEQMIIGSSLGLMPQDRQ